MGKILVASHQNLKMNQKNHWSEHLTQNRHSIVQQEVESQPKFHHFFGGSTSWFKYEELVEHWLDLTVLEDTTRGQALKNRLFRDAEMYKGPLNRDSRRATESSTSGIR